MPDVVALAVPRRRVVDLEEELEQLPIAEFGRIEHDLDRFGVGAVIAVRGVRHVAARIADARRDDAVIRADQVLHSPEAAAGKHRAFGCSLHILHLIQDNRRSLRLPCRRDARNAATPS